jgi:hypothetical protein
MCRRFARISVVANFRRHELRGSGPCEFAAMTSTGFYNPICRSL